MDDSVATNIWRQSLYPGIKEDNYKNAMYEELSNYLDSSFEEVVSIGTDSQKILNKEWDSKEFSHSAEFYEKNTTYLYNLTHWHAGYGEALARVKTIDFFKKKGVRKVLDFGSGIGSTAILFARNGFDVSVADVAENLLSYLGYRMKKRGLSYTSINLNEGELPRDYYDAITAIDVLEHVDHPSVVLENIYGSLKDGGYVCFNVCGSEGAPMHVSEAEQVLRHMNVIGFQKIKNHGVPLFIYQKREYGKSYIRGQVSYFYFNVRFATRKILKYLRIYGVVRKVVKSMVRS